MGRSYSLDLRKRVVAFVDGGRSRRRAAADLQVSPSFSVKLVARHRRTGTLEPQRQGRPPGTGKLASYRDFRIPTVCAVEVAEDPTTPDAGDEVRPARRRKAARTSCTIEIALKSGDHVRVEGSADVSLVARIISALRRA